MGATDVFLVAIFGTGSCGRLKMGELKMVLPPRSRRIGEDVSRALCLSGEGVSVIHEEVHVTTYSSMRYTYVYAYVY